MVGYSEVMRPAGALTLGLQGKRIAFDHRPYAKRTPAEQQRYDELAADVADRGLINPLITWQGHVLVGQRRCEIAKALGVQAFRCWEIAEDVREWWKPDLPKLDWLRDQYTRTGCQDA